jgi:hypothetical protein
LSYRDGDGSIGKCISDDPPPRMNIPPGGLDFAMKPSSFVHRLFHRPFSMIILACVLMFVGIKVHYIPGIIIGTQVGIAKGTVKLSPNLAQLNNWCCQRIGWIMTLCYCSAGVLVVGGILLFKIALSQMSWSILTKFADYFNSARPPDAPSDDKSRLN